LHSPASAGICSRAEPWRRLIISRLKHAASRLTVCIVNDTIARLQGSFEQLRRFTADSSHELRTPLAVVRGIGEAAVAQRRTADEYEEAIGSMLEEVDRMSRLVDTLLRLSHGDAGAIRVSRTPQDLGELAREVAASLGILAEERNQSVELHVAEQVIAPADRLVLREAPVAAAQAVTHDGNSARLNPTGSKG
jgi:signal transduction histidine kinase